MFQAQLMYKDQFIVDSERSPLRGTWARLGDTVNLHIPVKATIDIGDKLLALPPADGSVDDPSAKP